MTDNMGRSKDLRTTECLIAWAFLKLCIVGMTDNMNLSNDLSTTE